MAPRRLRSTACVRCGTTVRGYYRRGEAVTCDACMRALHAEQLRRDLAAGACLACGNPPERHPLPDWPHAPRLTPTPAERATYDLPEEMPR